MAEQDPRDASMRASDADREAVAERLRIALGEGRLDIAEYEERVGRAYGAITRGDLAKLIVDLPEPEPEKPSAELVRKQRQHRRQVKEWRDWAGMSVLLIGVWAIVMLTGGVTFFWPIIPMGIWAVIIIAGAFFGEESESDERQE